VRALKRNWQPDILHLHFPSPSGIFHLRTLNASSAPVVLAMHTHMPDWKTGSNTLSGLLLQQSAWVTANSAATLQLARDAAQEITGRSSIIYNGLAEPSLPPAPLNKHQAIVACAGRLVLKKGIDVAIRAMVPVRQQIPHARLLIAGDGPERSRLEQLATDLGLGDRVAFRGWVKPENMSAFLNEATVLAVPSRTMEPFGNVAVEAMQMGRPVVATSEGGLAEVVAHGDTGFLVNSEDAAALAKRIVELMANPELSKKMGEAGRARARLLFSLERYVQDYIKLYRSLAG
jgi:glycosyltransferase involved in cell wall biosynthesis